jgi:hypothetical protein
MIRDHATIEELLAARALGGLDDDDVETLERELAAHGDCAECRSLEATFDETAGRLAFSLDPEPVSDAVVDRILASAPGDEDVVRIGEAPSPTDEVDERRGRRTGRGWRTAVAVAAAILLVVVAGAIVTAPRTAEIGGVTAAQRFVRFEGDGDLAMAFVPGQPGAAFIGTGLPDPGPGNLYEIWLIRGDTPVSGGCVSPSEGRLATFIDADVSQAELMAVTIEPSSCPSQPTSPPFATAQLPSA